MRVVLYLHLGIGRGVEHNGHQRFLFNVYKRFLFLSRFLRFLTFFYIFYHVFYIYEGNDVLIGDTTIATHGAADVTS